jgi:hypothetical protein
MVTNGGAVERKQGGSLEESVDGDLYAFESLGHLKRVLGVMVNRRRNLAPNGRSFLMYRIFIYIGPRKLIAIILNEIRDATIAPRTT